MRRPCAASGLTAGTLISTSNSSLDNVEHLFHYHLPAGQYLLEVSSTANNISYALAWDAQLGAGPQLTATRDALGLITLNASELDPMVTYTIESSPTLLAPWTSEYTFRTADVTPSFQHTWQTSPSTDYLFYRLRWTPVR